MNKGLTVAVFGLVGVIAIAFVGSLVTAVQVHQATVNPPPATIPMPAIPATP